MAPPAARPALPTCGEGPGYRSRIGSSAQGSHARNDVVPTPSTLQVPKRGVCRRFRGSSNTGPHRRRCGVSAAEASAAPISMMRANQRFARHMAPALRFERWWHPRARSESCWRSRRQQRVPERALPADAATTSTPPVRASHPPPARHRPYEADDARLRRDESPRRGMRIVGGPRGC